MSTKIILTVDNGLSAQEIDDLRFLLSDAIGEFVVCCEESLRSATCLPRVSRDYSNTAAMRQMARQAQLARKLAAAAATLETFDMSRFAEALTFMQASLGMTEEEARATYNQLMDVRMDRVAKHIDEMFDNTERS